MSGQWAVVSGQEDSPPKLQRVIKLGGSLLADSDWIVRLRRWLALQQPMSSVLIVGGGALADIVRQWDRNYPLDAEVAHWLAIDAMSMTARLVAQLLPEGNWTDSWQVLLSAGPNRDLIIFDPRRWLHDEEAHAEGVKLSRNWDTTSDSIAARIAELLGCTELVLLKSCLPTAACARREDLAGAGYVDARFPLHAARLPAVRCVNLRDADFAERRYQSPSFTFRQ